MIGRLLLLVLALAILAGLLYLQQPQIDDVETTAAQIANADPGFVAIGAELIETGDDGHPLYRLEADRIAQPVAGGTIYLTAPTLHYQPAAGNPWVLTAREGQLPQSAHTADLMGSVQAEGKPSGSATPMRFNTDTLHLNMEQQVASTAQFVQVDWVGGQLRGRGMRANLKSGQLDLLGEVSGVLQR